MPSANSIPIVILEIHMFGGAERSVIALSRWLYEHGHESHVLTYVDTIGLERYASHPLEVVQLRPKGGVQNKVRALGAHLATTAARPILSGYQPALHATLAGIRGFHSLMHDTPSLFGDAVSRSWTNGIRIAISNRIIARGLKSGGVTAVNSEYLRAECLRDFGIDAKIVRMGGLVTGQSSSPHPVRSELNILSVCRIEGNKRIDWILRALASLESSNMRPSSMVDWRLHLIGKGSLIPQLTELAHHLGLGDRVTFHGFVSDEDLETFYASAHLFIMPAVQGYGIPALEALQRGVPVLLHRESGVSDILLHTPWAFVMRGDETQMAPALAHAIRSVMACRHCNVPLPPLPTEETWAKEVATLFGYGDE